MLGAMVILFVFFFLYKIHAELARLSGSSLFLWAFWIFVVSVFVSFGVIGKIIGFVGFIIVWVLLFIAWWHFGKVEKR